MSAVIGLLLGALLLLAGWVGYRMGRGDAETEAVLRRLSEQMDVRPR